ncbi:MAG: type II toxin-antitoxin system Phd/YefM family antitoxin [Deinococcota bacterium]|jgi:hypothetical protein|nr:type II toxin-antitoxin system Phd/YefM family antitoxin [Deinococcota bacterium]
MNTLELHPSFIERDGKREYAVLPYDEYLELQALIEDAQDLLSLRQAKQEDDGERVSLAEVEERLRDAVGEDWEERAS